MIVALHIESNKIKKPFCQITEISAIKFDDSGIKSRFHSYYKSDYPILKNEKYGYYKDCCSDIKNFCYDHELIIRVNNFILLNFEHVKISKIHYFKDNLKNPEAIIKMFREKNNKNEQLLLDIKDIKIDIKLDVKTELQTNYINTISYIEYPDDKPSMMNGSLVIPFTCPVEYHWWKKDAKKKTVIDQRKIVKYDKDGNKSFYMQDIIEEEKLYPDIKILTVKEIENIVNS